MQIFDKQQGLPKRSPKEDAQAKRGYVDVYKGLMCIKTKVFHQQSVAFNTPEDQPIVGARVTIKLKHHQVVYLSPLDNYLSLTRS